MTSYSNVVEGRMSVPTPTATDDWSYRHFPRQDWSFKAPHDVGKMRKNPHLSTKLSICAHWEIVRSKISISEFLDSISFILLPLTSRLSRGKADGDFLWCLNFQTIILIKYQHFGDVSFYLVSIFGILIRIIQVSLLKSFLFLLISPTVS